MMSLMKLKVKSSTTFFSPQNLTRTKNCGFEDCDKKLGCFQFCLALCLFTMQNDLLRIRNLLYSKKSPSNPVSKKRENHKLWFSTNMRLRIAVRSISVFFLCTLVAASPTWSCTFPPTHFFCWDSSSKIESKIWLRIVFFVLWCDSSHEQKILSWSPFLSSQEKSSSLELD